VHLNRHGFQRLLWLYDIALFLDRFGSEVDWQAVAHAAQTEGVLPCVHHCFRLAQALLGVPVPEEAFVATAPRPLPNALWRSMWPLPDLLAFEGGHERGLVFRKRLTDPWLLGNLLMMGRTAEKLTYFARRAFPPSAFLAEKYGAGGKEPYGRLLARRWYAKAFGPPRKTEA
jgi:hypothetical protein